MTVSFGDLKLDQLGRVVLTDENLREIESVGSICAGGGDGQTNSGQCLNSWSCNNTTNGQCTNTQNACDRATNAARCVEPKPQQLEIEV